MSGRHGEAERAAVAIGYQTINAQVIERENALRAPRCAGDDGTVRQPAGSRRQSAAQRRPERTMAAWDHLEARAQKEGPGE
jgi:hypothetical protein